MLQKTPPRNQEERMSQDDEDPFFTSSSFPANPYEVNESFPPQYGSPSISPPPPRQNAKEELEDVGSGGPPSSNALDNARLPEFMPPDTLSSPFDDDGPFTYNTTTASVEDQISPPPTYASVVEDNESPTGPSYYDAPAQEASPAPPPTYVSYVSQSYDMAAPEYGGPSTRLNDFIRASSPFEGLSLETSDDNAEASGFVKRRKSVLESLTLPTLERRSVGFATNSPRRSFIDDVSPASTERRSFSESPDISRSTSIMEVVSFLPSVPQPQADEDVSSTSDRLLGRLLPLPIKDDILEGFTTPPAKRRSIIDGIPAPARTSTTEVVQAQMSTLPDNRKSTLFAFDRFYSIDEEDARPAQPSAAQDRSNISAHKMHKTPMVIGAQRDMHLLSTHQLIAITCFAVAGVRSTSREMMMFHIGCVAS